MSADSPPALDGPDALRLLARRVAAHLRAAGVPDEQLAHLRPSRRIGPWTSRPRLLPAGRAWRLGVVLLDESGTVWLTGTVVRAVAPADFSSDKTLAAERRRELQRLASRAFRQGDTVNLDQRLIVLSDGDPVAETDGSLSLRLPDGSVSLDRYVWERAELLAERAGLDERSRGR